MILIQHPGSGDVYLLNDGDMVSDVLSYDDYLTDGELDLAKLEDINCDFRISDEAESAYYDECVNYPNVDWKVVNWELSQRRKARIAEQAYQSWVLPTN